MTTTHKGRTFDYRPHFDDASRDYPIRSVIGRQVVRTRRVWGVGRILDQGVEGACVGHGWAGEALASPVRVDFIRAELLPGWPHDPQAFAFALYDWCRRNDEWDGEAYSGTSVLAGAKGMKMLRLIPEYRWAFGVDDVVDTLVAHGPVVLGIPWTFGMYDAPGGELHVTGHVVGGHCIVAVGFDPAHVWADGSVGPAIALLNSWGLSWGIDGLAWIPVPELAPLLANGRGEACVPVRRSYGRTPRRRTLGSFVAAIWRATRS
ncbi:MAG: hypothetical protein LC798_10885 [Chloroflexi bacterium]|nr:hypothetical protein [Chloroflexota bacterium]